MGRASLLLLGVVLSGVACNKQPEPSPLAYNRPQAENAAAQGGEAAGVSAEDAPARLRMIKSANC